MAPMANTLLDVTAHIIATAVRLLLFFCLSWACPFLR